MSKSPVVLLAEAWRDLDLIADFYLKKQGPASADTILDKLLDELSILSEFPLSGCIHPEPGLAAEGYRKLVLDQTYVAVYKVIGGTVYVYRVVNGRTDYPRLLR